MRIWLLLLACSSAPAGHAHVTTGSSDIDLTVSSARIDNGQLVLTWTSSADAGIYTPFFQIVGVKAIEGNQDPLFTEVSFFWPGSHDPPRRRPCDCMGGTIVAKVDEAAETGTVDLDLMVPFTDESACPGDCPSDFYTTDLGTFFVPDRQCDGGTTCTNYIACPGQSTDPVQVYPDDFGGFTAPVQECANPGLKTSHAHVVASATLTKDEFGY